MEARDECGTIGAGLHRRAVVDCARFVERAEKKRAQRAIAGINASKVADRSRIADFENIIRQVDEIL